MKVLLGTIIAAPVLFFLVRAAVGAWHSLWEWVDFGTYHDTGGM
jgi:hypothetical protein